MVKNNVIQIRLDDVHVKLIDGLMPYFGNKRGEIIRNIVLRWIESNIANPNIIELEKRGVINLKKKKEG